MGSLSQVHRFHLPLASPRSLPLSRKPSPPLLLISHKPSPRPLTTVASAQNPKPQSPPNPLLSSLLRPTAAAIFAAAAALLSFRVHSPPPSLASPPSPPSETLPAPHSPDDVKERFVEQRLLSDPEDVGALHALMEIKLKLGKVPDTILVIDRLIRLLPKEKELLLLKAQLLNYTGDADAAKSCFEEVLKGDPLAVEAYHGLVLIATQNEEEEKGDKELGEVMERVEVAMEACKKEERKEDLRDFRLLVAQVRVIEGEYDEALGVYRELVVEEPKDFRPYLCQGIVYTLLRKKDEAERQFKEYRRLMPEEHPYAQYIEENMSMMKAMGMKDREMDGILRR